MPAAPHHSYACPVLIGRGLQVEALELAMRRAKSGAFTAVLLSGEAGIGKSRLAAEAIARALAEGFGVLRGDCFERGRTLPFSAVLELLRSHLAGRDAQAIEDDLGPSATEIVKLVPELAAILPGLTASPALASEEEKHRLFYALLQFLSRAAARQPQVVLFEDLHWSDETTLEFLEFLCRHAAGPSDGSRLFLLLTYRSDEVQPALARFLAEVDRRRAATDLTLDRLTMAEADVMIRATLDLRRPIRRAYLEALHAVTGGNPFFIEEVLKVSPADADPGAVASGAGQPALELRSVPRTVQEAVRRRATELSGPARGLLDRAAACGARFDVSLLGELTGEDSAVLLASLKELLSAQLIVEESANRFSFRHALTRQAIYTQLLATERRDLHRQIGETLLRLCAGSPEQLDMYAGDLAYHFYEGEVWDEALRCCERAAELAARLSTPTAVVQHLNRALEASQRLSLPPSARLMRQLANAYEVTGDFENAQRTMEVALEAARREGDEREQWQALIGLGAVWSARDYSRTGDYWRSALDLAERVGDQTLRAHSLNRVGNWHLNIEQPAEAIENHEAAEQIFERIGDIGGIAETVDLLGMAWYLGGDLVRSRAYYERALLLFEQLRDNQGYVSSLSTLSVCASVYHTDTLLPAVGFAQGVEWLERARTMATDLGWRAAESYALFNIGLVLGPAGDYGRALECTLNGLAIAEEIGHLAWTSAALWTLGSIQLDLLALETSRATLERAYATAQRTGSLHWRRCTAGSLARCYLSLDQQTLAANVLDETLELQGSPRTLGERTIQAARAELALASGDPHQALELLNGLSTVALSDDTVPPRLGKLSGDALLLSGDRSGAEAAYLQAAKLAQQHGQRGLLWRIHAALSRLYRETGQRSRSLEERQAAQSLIDDLAGTISSPGQREAFLAAAAAHLPPEITQRQAAKVAFGGLTERERELASLVARGLSNAEIAKALVISERTVETHITNILSKLGFSSRSQIAAWAVKTGLPEPNS